MLRNMYSELEIFERSDGGFSSVTYESIGTFQGYIQPVSASQDFTTGKNGEKVTYRLYTDIATPITYANKIIQNGIEYVILYEQGINGVVNLRHHKEVYLGSIKWVFKNS